MRASSTRTNVHMINDISGLKREVPMQDSIRVVKDFDAQSNAGWDIVVGKLDLIKKLSIRVSRSILHTKSINFETMNEAIAHLKKEDPDLSWDKAILPT